MRAPTKLPATVDRNAIIRAGEQSIIETVCSYYDTTPDELRGKSRRGRVVRARHMTHYLLTVLPISYSRISTHTLKDHATVMWSKSKVENHQAIYKDIRLELLAIINSLNN